MTRTETFTRNDALERLLEELNVALAQSESALDVAREEQFSKLFVVGPLRSGTTLMMQWLASSGFAAYPTNMLSRFYGAPMTGAKIQQLLTDPAYNFRNEILDFNSGIAFSSENGKTRGALAPNEFWYFWRRFLPYDDLDYRPDEDVERYGDLTGLRDELNGLANIFGRPFALKAMIMNQNLLPLNAQFSKAVFLRMSRSPTLNIQSALRARLRQTGDMRSWYSFKIREFPDLVTLDPLQSVAGQIAATTLALEHARSEIPPEKWIDISYETLCDRPAEVYEQISAAVRAHSGAESFHAYTGPQRFDATRTWTLTEYSENEAGRAYETMYAHLKSLQRAEQTPNVLQG